MADIQQETLGQYVTGLLNRGTTRDDIIAELLEQGHDERFVRQLVQETAKLRYARRRSQGMALILVGAVICFVSFLLTINSSFSHSSFPVVLYGLTSVGIILVFAGFMMIF